MEIDVIELIKQVALYGRAFDHLGAFRLIYHLSDYAIKFDTIEEDNANTLLKSDGLPEWEELSELSIKDLSEV